MRRTAIILGSLILGGCMCARQKPSDSGHRDILAATVEERLSEGYSAIAAVKTAVDMYIAGQGTLPADLKTLAADGYITSENCFDGSYYDDYSWDGAYIDGVTKRFIGTIRARKLPDEDIPDAEITWYADGKARKGP